jgi:hypothetical protein
MKKGFALQMQGLFLLNAFLIVEAAQVNLRNIINWFNKIDIF